MRQVLRRKLIEGVPLALSEMPSRFEIRLSFLCPFPRVCKPLKRSRLGGEALQPNLDAIADVTFGSPSFLDGCHLYSPARRGNGNTLTKTEEKCNNGLTIDSGVFHISLHTIC